MEPSITTVEKDGKFEAVLVKVCFSDEHKRALYLQQPNPSSKAIAVAVCQKEELDTSCRRVFSLWIVSDVLELRLRPLQDVDEAIRSWPKWLEKYGNEVEAPFKLVYKKDALVTVETEKFVTNDVALKLLYHEAVRNVLSGKYPAALHDSLFLASLQLQISYGDYSSAKFQPGFLITFLENFMSPFHRKQMSLEELEGKVLVEYQKLLGILPKKAMLAYLSHARTWPVYGSVFYPACKSIPPGGIFSKRTENYMIGVNMKGIHVVDLDKNKIVLSEPYSEIAWENSDDSIVFEYGPADMPKEMAFITPCADLIDMLASKAIARLEK